MTKRTRLCAVFLAGAMLTPLAATAGPMPNDDVFCKAIGLSMEGRMQCVDQLANTTSDDDRASVQAMWVSRSAASPRQQWSGSLYQPVVDANAKNGTPGTPYQYKAQFVPNTVTRDIERALRTVMMNPPDAYETGRVDR